MNCASYIPNNTMQYQSFSPATLLINKSKNINLIKIYIEYSPGIALAIFDSLYFHGMSFNLTLINCTISHSRGESLVVFGTTSLLLERTLITNCSRGINSYKADIMIKNFDVSNCTSSSVVTGHVMVTEGLQIFNSSLTINGSIVLFTGDKPTLGFIVILSYIFVREVSVLQFHRFNGISLNLTNSTLTLDNNSTMTFTQNNAYYGVAIVSIQDSYFGVSNGSTLSITNNTVIGGKLISWCNSSVKISGGRLLFKENICQYYSILILAINTTLISENASIVIFTCNTIHTESYIFHHDGGWMSFSESALVIRNNS